MTKSNYRTIYLYSSESCPPCIALKHWFAERGIPTREINVKLLSGDALAALNANILSVSRFGRPTVPAVEVVLKNGETRWVSNHGLMDIREMTTEISKTLGL